VTLDLPEGDYSGDWINVRTGKIERSDDVRATRGDVILKSPDFMNGIALRLKRAVR